MKNKLFVLCAVMGCGANLMAATLCSGSSAAVKIDQASGARVAAASEAIRYSAAWETTASGATAVVAVNGTTLKSATGTGSVTWTPTRNGTYTLTHKVMNGSTQVGSALSATFTVAGIYPSNPTISPATETKFVGSQEVTLACGTAGATIYYTLDGSEPTMESLVYSGPFSVTQTTTVIARAFFENGDASLETVSATYILNKVATPEISPATGSTFTDSQTVTISCPTEGAAIYYTTDGSDPTSESTAYRRFRISGRTVVKAIAYVDGMAVSDVATAEYALGRCADPVISGIDSFMGKRRKVSIACATEDAVVRYTTNGIVPNSHSARYTGPFYVMDTCTVKAVAFKPEWFDSSVVSHGVTRIRGLGDSVGLPDQAFATSGAAGWADADGTSLKSETIGNNQQSVLSTTFVGKGQLTFRWKTSCEEDEEQHDWDHVVFKVDGKEIARQDGQTDWLEIAHTIKTVGSHKAEWIYVKDDFDGEGEDCAWLKDVVWMPEMTQTTEVPVPTAWLKEIYPTLGDYYFDYEEQANETAANGTDPVWACYVTGVDPTDALSSFVAYIAMDGETPVVTWSPDLNEGAGKVGTRVYTIMGSNDLKTWAEVADGAEGDFHFFKVKVALP